MTIEFNKSEDEMMNGLIRHYGREYQLGILVEELAELIQAIQKHLRFPDDEARLYNIVTETSDTLISLNMLKLIMNRHTNGVENDKWFENNVREEVSSKINYMLHILDKDIHDNKYIHMIAFDITSGNRKEALCSLPLKLNNINGKEYTFKTTNDKCFVTCSVCKHIMDVI